MAGDPANAAVGSFDDATWKNISLPGAWNEDAAFKVPIDQHPTGIAWYRKHFKLPPGSEGKKVFLEFEGIRQAGEFYLNGSHIGRHENGAMAVGLDITQFVKPAPEENVIAVRTDNSWTYREKSSNSRYQWADRNFNANFGGIPKNVKLHIKDRLYQTLPIYSNLKTTGVYIYASDFDLSATSANITTLSEVRNEHDSPKSFVYEVQVIDQNAGVVGAFAAPPITLSPGETRTVQASANLRNLHFWSWGYGYLYDVRTVLKVEGQIVDEVLTRTGFRKTEFGNGMVKLNGRVLQLKGYAQRTSNEWPALGSAVPPWLSDFSNGLIVEGNGNLVRWMHITPAKQDVESCDRVGLLQAMPAGDAEGDARGRQWAQRVELMRDAIIYNRNNPSILFYEGGNESISEDHMRELKAVRDQYDPHGGRAIGAREMLDSKVAEYGGEMLYINKSAGIPFWAMEYSRDEGLRKYWDEFSPPFHRDGDGPLYKGAPAPDYNRNQDSHAIENVRRWYDYWQQRPGTGNRVNSGGVNIIFSDSNTHYRGAENYRRSGEVDAMRIPKDGFWAHQVMWDGWVDVERPAAKILGHWNYARGTRKNVYVVSSADKVELLLNGNPLGTGEQSSRFLYTFKDVQWLPGLLCALGRDSSGSIVCSNALLTAGQPSAIKVSCITGPGGLKADGADVALVQFEVIDENGRRCPTATNTVAFDLMGPAEWRGGIAQGPNNFILSKMLPVECGVNRVLIRSLRTPGSITLLAKSEGLTPASAKIDSIPFQVTDGLATQPPAQGLPMRLGRGATPTTPSFQPAKITVPIVNVVSGTNNATAKASFDDNELTSWTSNAAIKDAWIEYTLERTSTLSEASVKFLGWRQRSYPIRILVDGVEVYKGTTPRNLGYVNLPLKPATGRTVKVELLRPADIGDAFKMTEVSNQQNAGGGVQQLAKGTLGIVEIEFLEPAKSMSFPSSP